MNLFLKTNIIKALLLTYCIASFGCSSLSKKETNDSITGEWVGPYPLNIGRILISPKADGIYQEIFIYDNTAKKAMILEGVFLKENNQLTTPINVIRYLSEDDKIQVYDSHSGTADIYFRSEDHINLKEIKITNPFAEEKETTQENDISPEQAKSYRLKWNDNIILSTSSKNGKEVVMIKNNTPFFIEEVTVFVEKKNNEGNVITHEVPLYNIARNTFSDRTYPGEVDSTCSFRIAHVKSSEMQFCYDEGNYNQNSSDPYRCQ